MIFCFLLSFYIVPARTKAQSWYKVNKMIIVYSQPNTIDSSVGRIEKVH